MVHSQLYISFLYYLTKSWERFFDNYRNDLEEEKEEVRAEIVQEEEMIQVSEQMPGQFLWKTIALFTPYFHLCVISQSAMGNIF